MKRLILVPIFLLLLIPNASAEEISGEVDVSWADPYDVGVPSFSASFRPDIFNFDRLSFGGGLAIYVSSRLNYETTPLIEFEPDPEFQTDSTVWRFFDDNFTELVNYEIFTETRFRLMGKSDDDHWKGWLTLHLGYVDHTSRRTLYTTVAEYWEHADSLGNTVFERLDSEKFTFSLKTEHDATFYFSPGILVGIGNFIVGYRHWFYLDDKTLIEGEPARNLGTIRLGYRFTW
jgi:hypothetical protein